MNDYVEVKAKGDTIYFSIEGLLEKLTAAQDIGRKYCVHMLLIATVNY